MQHPSSARGLPDIELDLRSLLDRCNSRHASDFDFEIATRIVELHKLCNWHFGEKTWPLYSPTHDPWQRFTVGKIARLCALLLEQVARELAVLPKPPCPHRTHEV
jgi:hypothetical protein